MPDNMRGRHLSAEEQRELLDALARYGSAAEAARQMGVNYKTALRMQQVVRAVQRATDPDDPVLTSTRRTDAPAGADTTVQSIRASLKGQRALRPAARPQSITVRRYILTSAQNNTPVNKVVWRNLLALRDHYDARLIVGRYIYNLDALGQRAQEKDLPATGKSKRVREERWWAPEIMPYVLDQRLALADDLEWCGHMNILPTAVRPLGDLHNYTGTRSAIFPHPSIALESVPTGKYERTKFNYTTGAVTERNYIQRKAGQKAEFHHTYGAALVEVDVTTGDWWIRQLNADGHGVICDLGLRVEEGVVTDRHTVEAINWGDLHVSQLEPWMAEVCWGKSGIMDTLRPRYQFMHDTLDFSSRSHHDLKNPHVMFRKHVDGADSVEAELAECRDFLHFAGRQFCQTVMVDSNHDNALTRWARETSHKNDPVNALFYLRMELAIHEAMSARNDDFHVLEWALRHVGLKGDFKFLRTDESFLICDHDGNGIECGNHGHLGVNGARGSDVGYVKTGRRMNIGHGHYALIWQGLYRAGVQASLDQGYNTGLSSWSQSMIVTYSTGKRAILTFRNRRPWA